MTREEMEELLKKMILTFNDGYEQVIIPRLNQMQEEIGEKIKESENRIKKELREEFKTGQQNLSNRLEEIEVDMGQMKSDMGQMKSGMGQMKDSMDEMKGSMDEMNEKVDQVIASNKDQDYQIKEQRKRLDKVEIIVKAN